MKSLTLEEFNNEILESTGTHLLLFYMPEVEISLELLASLEQESGYSINVKEEPELTGVLGIKAVPTVLVLKDGIPIAFKVGLMTLEKFKEWYVW